MMRASTVRSATPPLSSTAAGADQTGSAAFRENPVSPRAPHPRERSFPGAAAGRSSSGESESRRACHGGGRRLSVGRAA